MVNCNSKHFWNSHLIWVILVSKAQLDEPHATYFDDVDEV